MCLAVPGKIISLTGEEEALADLGGIEKTINVGLIDNPQPGDWVIIHVGFALQRIDEEEARKTLKILAEMGEKDEEEAGA